MSGHVTDVHAQTRMLAPQIPFKFLKHYSLEFTIYWWQNLAKKNAACKSPRVPNPRAATCYRSAAFETKPHGRWASGHAWSSNHTSGGPWRSHPRRCLRERRALPFAKRPSRIRSFARERSPLARGASCGRAGLPLTSPLPTRQAGLASRKGWGPLC